MKDELEGRVGCVKTRKVGDYTVQNFSLCEEKIVEDGIPRLYTKWHNVFAENLEEVKPGDIVHVIGLEKKHEFVQNDGYTMVLREFVADRLTIIKK